MIQLKGRAILNTSKFLISVHISGNFDMKILIEHGANVNLADNDGHTLLHVAALKGGFYFTIKLL